MKTNKQYFETSEEILKSKCNEYGYTKEECMLLDESAETHFYNNETDSAEGAQWLRNRGFCICTMLKMTDGRIAVLVV